MHSLARIEPESAFVRKTTVWSGMLCCSATKNITASDILFSLFKESTPSSLRLFSEKLHTCTFLYPKYKNKAISKELPDLFLILDFYYFKCYYSEYFIFERGTSFLFINSVYKSISLHILHQQLNLLWCFSGASNKTLNETEVSPTTKNASSILASQHIFFTKIFFPLCTSVNIIHTI